MWLYASIYSLTFIRVKKVMLSISSTKYFFIRVVSTLLLMTTPLFAVSGSLKEEFCQSNLSDLHLRFMPSPNVYGDSLQSIIILREKLNEPMLPSQQEKPNADSTHDCGVFPNPLRSTIETRFNHNNNDDTLSLVPNLSLGKQWISNETEINHPSFYAASSSYQPSPVVIQREENNQGYYQSHYLNFSVQSPIKSTQKNYNDDASLSSAQKYIEVKDQEVIDQSITIFRKGYNRATVEDLRFIMRHFPFHEAVINFNHEGLKYAYMPCHHVDFKQHYKRLGFTKWGYKKRKHLINF